MFEVIGHREEHEYGYGGWTGNVEYIEEVVATFDNGKAAEDYIKAAKLKQPIREIDCTLSFRRSSLLRAYSSAEVRECIAPEIPPHNPTI